MANVGTSITTKADVPLPAGVNTPIVVAADISIGTISMTVVNTGANPVRVKGAGEGGGDLRGDFLAANGGSATYGGVGLGALAPLDAFSAVGSSVSIRFEGG